MTAFSIIPLTIEARGEIITNNLPEFRELVREALGNINRDLVTDEQFGQAELDVKALKEAEDAVRTAAVKAFDDQLKALVDGLNETAEEIRVPRLELEKIIAARKEAVKSEIVEEFLAAFDIEPKLARKHFLTGLQTQIKGKRTLESRRTACRGDQTTEQAMISKCREILASFEKAHGQDLISDRRDLELEKPDGLEAELRRRFEAKRAREEKARLEAEAAAAKAEAAKAQAALAEASKPPLGTSNIERPTSNVEVKTPTNVEQGPWKQEGTSVAVAEPVTSTQLHNQGIDAEWKEFKAACLAAFVPLKAARERLKHGKNIAKATIFSNAINKIWKEEMQ